MTVKLKAQLIILMLFVFTTNMLVAQVNPSAPSVEGSDDKQLYGYYQELKTQGYSDAQIKALAESKGVSAEQIADFENRMSSLNGTQNKTSSDADSALNIKVESQSVNQNVETPKKRSRIFGMDFFSNSNISFSPNLNLSTPINYKLGPGDELVVSIWGASESTYNLPVNREGAVTIPNVGPILLNGLTIEDATKKIKGSLKKIYNGLNAPENSPYRVNLGVSLATVRTVQVNIIGEVSTPGTYSLSSLSTVLNALYAAGGPSEKGTFRDIKLVRNGQETVSFDMYEYLTKGSQEGNNVLRDQDVIIVTPYLSRISISGEVKRPGLFELKPNETLSDLLRFTSGFSSSAYKDIVTVERISGDAKRVLEINVNKSKTEKLKDGDLIEVKSILGEFENKVQLDGAVFRPGIYELTEGLTVSQLINKANGVLDKAFLSRAIILRDIDKVRSEAIPFSITEVMNNPSKDVLLKNNDVIKIYDKYNTQEKSYISISGAVNSPSKIPFVENISVEEMVLMSGGFSDDADINNIDIYRKILGERTEKLVETISFSSNGLNEVIGESRDIILKPNDRVSVRYLKGFKGELFVQVNGEVNYAGSYGLENKKVRISDVINLSGGVTDYAFVRGASLSRVNPFYKAEAQKQVVQDVKDNLSDEDVDIKLNNAKSLQVGIDLEKILSNPGSKYDMILKDGDIVTIPSIKETVKVEGEVLVPSLIRYDTSNNLKDYINSSGGFAENARRGKTYVVYLNGSIAATKRFLFFKSYPKLEAGALVIVPRRPDRSESRLSTQEVIGISTGFTTLALLIQNLTSN